MTPNYAPWLPETPLAVQILGVLVIVGLVVATEKERPEGSRRKTILWPSRLVIFLGGVYLVGWRWAVFQVLWETVSE